MKTEWISNNVQLKIINKKDKIPKQIKTKKINKKIYKIFLSAELKFQVYFIEKLNPSMFKVIPY